MTKSDRLIAAKRELETRGWWHGEDGHLSNDRLCAAQAIRATCAPDEFLLIAHFYQTVATGQARGLLDHLFNWNDARDRTLQDVLDAFDAAIAIAQEQEQEQAVREEVPCG